MKRSYKKKFQRWKVERETEGKVFYNCLSEVIDTDNDLAVGDMVTLVKSQHFTSTGRCVYIDSDAYWCPKRPNQLTLVRKGGVE